MESEKEPPVKDTEEKTLGANRNTQQVWYCGSQEFQVEGASYWMESVL